jgi:hypothetical protein
MFLLSRLGGLLVIAGLSILLVVGLVIGPSPLASAMSDPPYPPDFWDADEDGWADDSEVIVRPAGPDWTDKKRGSLERAVDQWRSNTQYDPTYAEGTGPVGVYLDGRDLQGCLGGLEPEDLAFTCTRMFHRVLPNRVYDDIFDSDITVNPSHPFAWGDVGYGSAPDKFSFQGVLTHEVGHTVRLTEERGDCSAGADRPTMCPNANHEQSYQFRTIENVDIASADTWY